MPALRTYLTFAPFKIVILFYQFPSNLFCCHEHNKGNGYSLKLGTFNQNFSINIHSESFSTNVKCWAHIGCCFMLSRTIDSSWKGSTGTEVSIKILVSEPQQLAHGNQKNVSKESMCFYPSLYSNKEEFLNLFLTCSSPFCLPKTGQHTPGEYTYTNLHKPSI